jgi:nicotinamidase-related amidase
LRRGRSPQRRWRGGRPRSLEGFERFVAANPTSLGVGKIALASGRSVSGFPRESHALRGAREITSFFGRRACFENDNLITCPQPAERLDFCGAQGWEDDMKSIALAFSVVLAAGSAAFGQTSSDKAAGKSMTSVQMPASPAPVAVTLDPKSTAMLVADIVEQTCAKQPQCVTKMVPNIAALLARARKAGVYVVYSVPRAGAAILPEAAPAPGDPIVVGQGQDRFFRTNLDDLLKAKNISNVILVGWRIDGSVVYTSVAATERGYTVVIPVDGSLASTDYDIAIGQYQILTQNSANADNKPLKPKASTLSRTDMISFQ